MITSFVNIYISKQEKHMIIINSNYRAFICYIIKMIFCMVIFNGRPYFSFHITIPKMDDTEIIIFKYKYKSLNSTGEKIWVVNGRLFYFNHDGKLGLYHLKIYITCYLNIYISVLFIECNGLSWNRTDANGLCASIFLNNMG